MSAQVFIAHSMDDVAWRDRLVKMLAPLIQVGLSCWDETQIQPGQHRQKEIDDAVGRARVAVLLVSPAFLASDFLLGQDLSTLLAAAHQDRRLRILWVAVRPCLWQQTALAAYHPVHESAKPLSMLSDSEADAALVAICQRIHAAVIAPDAFLGTVPSKNPYRGLSAFQVDEAHLFFGREALTEKLWQRFNVLYNQLAGTRLLAILGPSGSGKSSVARAGLLAALGSRPVPGPQAPRRMGLKPGEHPVRSLVLALHASLNQPAVQPDVGAQRKLIEDMSQPSKRGEFDGLTLWAANLPDVATAPLVVLVDQFEEIYTLCANDAERNAFVGLLLHAAADRARHISVVLTLRSDFLGETQRHHPELNRLIGEQAVIVTAMGLDEMRQAVAKPAQQAGRSVDDATVELLLKEATGSDGALPLLEFALTRIWEGMIANKAPGVTLREIGGVGGAVAGKAQEIYGALNEREQATARRALVRLVQLGEGTRDTRRRASVQELCGRGEAPELVLSILRRFSTENARLVTLSGDVAEPVAEVTHEALFEHWADLRRWIDGGRADRRFHDRAAESARLWEEAGRPAGRLWRPPDLDLLRDYQKRRPDEIGPLQAAFLNVAVQQQQRDKLLRWGAAAAVMAALSVAGGVYVTKERQRTEEQRQRIAEAKSAGEKIRQQLLSTYVERGRQLLVEQRRPLEALPWLSRGQLGGSTDAILSDLVRDATRTGRVPRTILAFHGFFVWSATFSPDGRRIVTTGDDNTARVWDTQSGRLLAELQGNGDSLARATFSPDGRRIVTTGDDNTAWVWEIDGGRLLTELKGGITSATFSPDGRLILTASLDKTARVWGSDGRRLLTELKGHEGRLTSATFSSDGRRIVTASDDKTARVWDVETGSKLAELKGHGAIVRDATFSPDGHRILTASEDRTACVWDAETGGQLLQLKGHHRRVKVATYSPDGRRILTTSAESTARVWDAETGRLLHQLHGREWIVSASYSPDGRQILIACEDETAQVWDAETGRLVEELTGHAGRLAGAWYSPDGHYLLTASGDQTGRVWDSKARRFFSELQDHGPAVSHVAYSPDGRHIVTACDDKTARVWEVETGRQIAILTGHGEGITSAKYSPDGKRIVTTSYDKTTRVWEAETGRLLTELKGHTSSVESATYSPNGRRILTASYDHTARVWDAETGSLLVELKVLGDDGSILHGIYSPDGRHIVTAIARGTAQIWEAETGHQRAELKGHAARVNSAAYSPDGRHLVTASSDRTARVWEAETGRLLAELKGHTGSVESAAYSQDGLRIVTASNDQTVRVWEAETGRLITILDGGVKSATYSPDGRRILAVSKDKTARVWDVSSETHSATEIARLLRCYWPMRFDREDSDVLVLRVPDPTECQGSGQPSTHP